MKNNIFILLIIWIVLEKMVLGMGLNARTMFLSLFGSSERNKRTVIQQGYSDTGIGEMVEVRCGKLERAY